MHYVYLHLRLIFYLFITFLNEKQWLKHPENKGMVFKIIEICELWH